MTLTLRERLRNAWQVAWRTGMVAGSLGTFPGLLNSWETVHAGGRAGIPTQIHLLSVVVYAEAYFLCGLGLGLGLGWFWPSLVKRAAAVAAGSAWVVFTAVGITLNVNYLPAFNSPISIATDLIVLAISLLLAAALYRGLASRPDSGAFARPWWIVALAGGVGALGAGWSDASNQPPELPLGEASPEAPNVLFILLDTVRADFLSAYGYPHPTTPWLEELAQRGVLFENAMAASCHTKPSTASIFTSRYPPAHQTRRLEEALPESAFTFPQALRAAGYQSAAFSANGLVSPIFGFGKGFERFYRQEQPYFMLLDLSEVLYRAYLGVPGLGLIPGVVLGTFVGWEWLLLPSRHGQEGLLDDPDEFSIEGLTRATLAWLDDERPEPFMAYVHALEPHDPYVPAAYLQERFEGLLGGAHEDGHFPTYAEGILPYQLGPGLPENERIGLEARYAAEIAQSDSLFRRLFEEVEKRSGDRDLLVVFTSDHGEEFHEHGGWGHGQSMYQESVHVPLVLAMGGGLPQGKRIERRVSMVDLAPTLLELLGIYPVESFQGASLLPVIGGEPHAAVSPVFSEIYWGGHHVRAYWEADRKVIEATSGSEMETYLFDLSSDPGELQNLVESDPVTAGALANELHRVREGAEAIALESHSIRIEGEIEAQMKALGYID